MLIGLEGFEGGGTTNTTMSTYLSRKYPEIAGGIVYRTTGRFSNNGLRLGLDSSVVMSLGGNKQTIIFGFAYKRDTATNGHTILHILDGSNVQLTIKNSGTELALYRGTGTLLGTTSGAGISDTIWRYIEVKVTIDNTSGAYEIRESGVNVLSTSGVDTQETANAYATSIKLFHIGGNYIYYDDIYICDNSGSVNNDFLGNCKVTNIKPNGDTVDEDFTPQGAGDNYVEVDDGQTVDDDTTYVETSNNGDKDLYEYEDVSGLGDIKGVQMYTEARETDATDFQIKSVCKSNTTESADTAQSLAAGYAIKNRVLELDPHTSALWTATNLNAAKFGMESIKV